jgi:hypothetical protein
MLKNVRAGTHLTVQVGRAPDQRPGTARHGVSQAVRSGALLLAWYFWLKAGGIVSTPGPYVTYEVCDRVRELLRATGAMTEPSCFRDSLGETFLTVTRDDGD